MKIALTTALCLLVVHAGCSQDVSWRAVDAMIDARYPTAPSITTDSLAERLADSTSARPVVLDARSKAEYAVSHVPTARRVDPDAERIPALDSLAPDTPIVVYCSVGVRSARVTTALREQGFTNVSNLRGSIFRWANESRPVVRDGEPVRVVHPYDATWGRLLDAELHATQP